jgi:hypothetical protein
MEEYRKMLKKRFTVTYTLQTNHYTVQRGRRGHDRMVVGFTTTYAISAYHH